MADLTKIIKYQDPEFKKKYSKGVSIYDAANDQRYYYDPTKESLSAYSLDAKSHDPYLDRGVEQIEFSSGLIGNPSSGSQSVASQYQFISPESDIYKQAQATNFGMGAPQTPEEAAQNAAVKAQLEARRAQPVSMAGTGQVSPETAKYFGMTPEQIAADRATNQIPTGATQVMNPAELAGLTESQIWRDPNSNKIYKLPPVIGGNVSLPDISEGAITTDTLAETANLDVSGIEKGKYQSEPFTSTIETSAQTTQAINNYLNLVTPPETETSKQAGNLTDEISRLLGETGGQSEMLQTELEKLGVDKLKQNLTQITNEINIRTAALNKRLAELESTPMTMARLSGAQAQANRVAQADIMFLQAQAQAAMNNISFAQEQAQAAVDAKYNPILEDLNIKAQQLQLLEGTLDKEETQYANALNLYLQDRQAAIEDAKQNESQVNSVVMEIIASNPLIANDRIIDQIKAAGSATEAMQIAAPLLSGGYQYVTSPAELTKLSNAGYEIVDIGGRKFARQPEVVAVSGGSSGGGYISGGVIPSGVDVEIPTFDEYIQQKVEGEPVGVVGAIMSNVDSYRSEYDDMVAQKMEEVQAGGTDIVTAYAEMVAKGQANLSSIPNSVRNEVALKVSKLGGATKSLSETAIKQIAETQNAIDGLLDLQAKVNDNLEYIGPIKGLQKLNPWSKARQIQADVDRIRQKVGKALEGGVLRKEDEEKYKKILATITDTPETASYKIEQLINDIQTDYNRYLEAQQGAGRYTGGFEEAQSTSNNNDPLGIL